VRKLKEIYKVNSTCSMQLQLTEEQKHPEESVPFSLVHQNTNWHFPLTGQRPTAKP